MESSQKEEGLPAEGSIGMETEEKCCFDCKTTKTPLWRSGPSGPKSLCNACGIRYRKKRPTPFRSSENDVDKGNIGKEKNMKKQRNVIKVNLKGLTRPRRQWGEVERAALLLMALSCGAVFA